MTNSFSCEVVITRNELNVIAPEARARELFVANFPCSPAMFGKASVSNLRKNRGEVVKGLLVPPPFGDELGCESTDNLHQVVQGTRQVRQFVQLLKRGDCSFIHKVQNYGHSQGLIVINSDPNQLFVMSGEISQSGDVSSNVDLPVSVLVSGNDGESIIQTLRDEQFEGHEAMVQIQLIEVSNEDIKFPHVEGSKEVLQISVSNSWGIHAVSRDNLGQAEFQLFITQPTVED